MTILFVILIVIASVALGFMVLIQNPKGGGLSGNVGGLSNQFMGVKQTTDVLEKGTWMFAGIIALLSLFSTPIFRGAEKGPDTSIIKNIDTKSTAPAQSSPNTVPLNTTPQGSK